MQATDSCLFRHPGGFEGFLALREHLHRHDPPISNRPKVSYLYLDLGGCTARLGTGRDEGDDLLPSFELLLRMPDQPVKRLALFLNSPMDRIASPMRTGIGRSLKREFDVPVRVAKHPLPVAAIWRVVYGLNDLDVLLHRPRSFPHKAAPPDESWHATSRGRAA
jgi:hypothetical protein